MNSPQTSTILINTNQLIIRSTSLTLLIAALVFSTLVDAKRTKVIESEFGAYVVITRDMPVLGNAGQNPNFAATIPSAGERLNRNTPNVKRYVEHLNSRHMEILTDSNVSPYAMGPHYNYAISGFTAALTMKEAKKVAAHPNVLMIEPVRQMELHSTILPQQVGLSGSGVPNAFGYTGEDVILAVVDDGIWPEHPSFADDGSYGPPPAHFSGTACDFGTTTDPVGALLDAPFTCNNKLLSAKAFNDTAYLVFGDDPPGIFEGSARSEGGHGTAVSSLAAGNAIPAITHDGVNLGTMRGTASRARLVFYNVGPFLFNGDLWDALDQAAADGVDLLNMSLGSIEAPFITTTEILALFAADSGVLIFQSQGNEGAFPDPSNQRSPWTVGVGGAVKDKMYMGYIQLGNGKKLLGTTVSKSVPNTDLVDGGECSENELDALGNKISGSIVLCRDLDPFPPELREYSGREFTHGLIESQRVKERGGVGVVITILPSGLAPDKFYNLKAVRANSRSVELPLIDLFGKQAKQLHRYIEKAKHPKARILEGGNLKFSHILAGHIAAGSTRGPSNFMSDIIKPDIAAPGFNRANVAANVGLGEPPLGYVGLPGSIITNMSGTSSSSPVATGVAALVVQAHPDWTPSMIKSAIMTTANHKVKADRVDPLFPDFIDTLDIVTTPATPFDTGSGIIWAGANTKNTHNSGHNDDDDDNGYEHYHYPPKELDMRGTMLDPGLVYNAGFFDWAAFTCGLGPDFQIFDSGSCDFLISEGLSIDPAQLNYPSIGVSQVAGVKVVKRTVLNLAGDGKTTRYRVKVEAPQGYTVSVSPTVLDIPIGESADYEVTITNVDAPVGEWRFGSLTWKSKPGDYYKVRSPIAIKAVDINVPQVITGSGTDGSLDIPVTFGYSGDYSVMARGLVPADMEQGTVSTDPESTFPEEHPIEVSRQLVADGYATEKTITVPAGTVILRLAIFDEFTSNPGQDDLDLHLFGPDDQIVASSFNATSNEVIEIINPTPGTYAFFVHGFGIASNSTTFTSFEWQVGGNEGNMTITPPGSATLGSKDNVVVDYSGLIAPNIYLGRIDHLRDGEVIGVTIINVNTAP